MNRTRAYDPMKKIRTKPASITLWASLLAMLSIVAFTRNTVRAEQPPPPCHPNPNAAADRAAVASRGDIVNLPQALKDRLIQLADRPHSYLCPYKRSAKPTRRANCSSTTCWTRPASSPTFSRP